MQDINDTIILLPKNDQRHSIDKEGPCNTKNYLCTNQCGKKVIAAKSSFRIKIVRKDTQSNVINHFETSKTGLSKCTHLPSNAETTSS